MKHLSHSSGFVAACLLFCVSIQVQGSIDSLIRMASATGEAPDQNIELLSWHWGATNPSTTHTTGTGPGKSVFQDLSLTKYVDRSTPVLIAAVATASPIERAVLYVRLAGSKPVQFYKVVCENVLVTSVQMGGGWGSDRLTESIALNFQKIGVEYVRIDSAGHGAIPIHFDWDILAGVPAELDFSDPVDFDRDGLPDNWERAYGTQVNVRDGEADLDRDGATNLEEYLAGTDPSKPDSVFVARMGPPNATGLATLSWNSASGLVYRVLVSDRPEGGFQLLRTVPSAGAGTTSILVSADVARKFFRVEAVPAQ